MAKTKKRTKLNITFYPEDYQFPKVVKWGAADTETITLIDGKVLPSDEVEKLVRENGTAWFRKHGEVKVDCWMFSDGYGTAFCEGFDDFVKFLTKIMCKTVWWYNAKFDFANMD